MAPATEITGMIGWWREWIEGTRLVVETQQVIALRMMRLALGGAVATREARRMVSEKAVALAAAQNIAATALVAGHGPAAAMLRAGEPVKRRLRANHRRLTRRA